MSKTFVVGADNDNDLFEVYLDGELQPEIVAANVDGWVQLPSREVRHGKVEIKFNGDLVHAITPEELD